MAHAIERMVHDRKLAAELGKQVEVLQGLQELSTGWFDGKPEALAAVTYLLSLRDWLDSDMQRLSYKHNPF